jgi:phenylacetate-CoA ligase
MTDQQEEQQEQDKWHFFSDQYKNKYIQTLLENEFIDSQLQHKNVNRQLKNIIRYSSSQVPWYRESFNALRINLKSIKTFNDLHKIPIISRETVISQRNIFLSQKLPPGHSAAGITSSSGTSGQPVKIRQSSASIMMFSLLKQREYRWFKFDPTKKLAIIRDQGNFRLKNNAYLQKKQTYQYQNWPYIGKLAATGKAAGYLHSNTIEDMVSWLQQQEANYLISYASTMEELSLYLGKDAKKLGLKGILGISTLFTPAIRELTKNSFKCTLQQNYGLNEIGLVATRCPEGERYHVHSEHCLVEIIDDNGVQVKDGESGKLLVTTLNNTVMPLIRYDTGDLAIASSGICPCGRTSPTFLKPTGRYRSRVFLPGKTWLRWLKIQEKISKLPNHQRAGLKKYQVHQTKDENFEIKLVCNLCIQPSIKKHLNSIWKEVSENGRFNLKITFIPAKQANSWGKYEQFTSEYIPPANADWHQNPPDYVKISSLFNKVRKNNF